MTPRCACSIATALLAFATPPRLCAQDWSIREPAIDGKNVAAWAKMLQQKEASVRLDAVRKLSALSRVASAAFPPLIEAMADPDKRVRRAAEEAIPESQDEAIRAAALDLARPLLTSKDPKLRAHGAWLLHDSRRPDAAKVLLNAYPDPDARVRDEIASALFAIPIPKDQERRLLEKWLAMDRFDDRDETGGPNAERWLTAAIGRTSLRVEAMRVGIEHAKAHLRLAAVELCPDPPYTGEDDLEPEKFRPILRKGAADADVRVRARALELIGKHESGEMFALAALGKGVRDPNPLVRDAAIRGLKDYKSANPGCVATLMTLTHHERPAVRTAAVQALHSFAQDERRVLRPLLPLFADPDPQVRREILRLAIAANSKDANVHAAILKTMRDADRDVSSYACRRGIEGLDGVPAEKIADALLQATREGSDWAAHHAAEHLAKATPPDERAVPILAERCQGTKDAWFVCGLLEFGDAGMAALEKAVLKMHPDVAAEALIWVHERKPSVALRNGLIEKALEGNDARQLKLLRSPSFGLWLDLKDVPISPNMAKNIIRLTKHEDRDVRYDAYGFLKSVPPGPMSREAFLAGTKDADEFVKQAAIRGLAESRDFSEPVLSVLRKVAGEHGESSESALQALFEAGLGDDERTMLLTEQIRHGRWTRSYRWFRDKLPRITKIVPAERLVAEWSKRIVRELEGEPSLGDMMELMPLGYLLAPTEIALPILTKAGCHWDPDIRGEAIATLAAYGPAARAALPMLEARSIDRNEDVASAARSAIAKIQAP